MVQASNPYAQPMAPWPALAAYSCQVRLPRSVVVVHYYDTLQPQAPVFLLVHGLGDEADTWRHILPALARYGRVIALDLPGFGGSDKPERAYTTPYFVQAVSELMDVLVISSATLVGHSMGGLIAQSMALEIPAKVERLVLISGCLVAKAIHLSLSSLLFLLPRLGEWQYNRLRKDPQAAYRSLAPYYHSLDGLPQADRDFLFQRVNQRVWSAGQRHAFLSSLRNLAAWVPGQQKSLPSRLAGFSLPTAIIWGTADAVNSLENGRWLAKLQPAARLVEIPLAGHNLHQENPQDVLNAIENFIQG
jgi:pimeloyl-ACP methyl ester carboxylesterase